MALSILLLIFFPSSYRPRCLLFTGPWYDPKIYLWSGQRCSRCCLSAVHAPQICYNGLSCFEDVSL